MKKFLAKIWLKRIRYKWSRLYRKLYTKKYQDVELPVVSSMADVSKCLREVEYKADKAKELYDVIGTPQSVWAKKHGDCDDFSSLAAGLIESWRPNRNPVLLTVITDPFKRSHNVCAYQFGKYYYCISNWLNCRTVCYDFKNYEDIAEWVARHTGSNLLCWDIVDPVTLKQIEFHG